MKHIGLIDYMNGCDVSGAWVDVPLYDIPQTVKRAVEILIKRGAAKVTVVWYAGVEKQLADLPVEIEYVYHCPRTVTRGDNE